MTRTEWRAFIRREIMLFIQYAVIASLAAPVAHDSLRSCDFRELHPLPPAHGGTDDINLLGMWKKWIAIFWIPWLTAFFPLALVRVVIVVPFFWLWRRFVGKTGDTVQTANEFSLRRECWPFFSYALISFLAMTYVLNVYIWDSWIDPFVCTDRYPSWLYPDAGVFKVVKILWERFYGPGLGVFVFLALVRLLAVFVVRKRFQRRDRT
jgi:hypothetical protein